MSEPCLNCVHAPVMRRSLPSPTTPPSICWSRCWPCWCDWFDLTPSSSELQRMSQRHRSNQGARVGRGRWHQVASEAALQARVGWLPGPDHHRGPHAERRNGCLVQSRYVDVVILTRFHHGFDRVDLMSMNIEFLLSGGDTSVHAVDRRLIQAHAGVCSLRPCMDFPHLPPCLCSLIGD